MKRLGAMIGLIALFVGLLPARVQGVELDVPAKAAVLMDATTGTVLYSKDEHTALPPASVTKVMTMLLIMEAIDSGRIGLTDRLGGHSHRIGSCSSQRRQSDLPEGGGDDAGFHTAQICCGVLG